MPVPAQERGDWLGRCPHSLGRKASCLILGRWWGREDARRHTSRVSPAKNEWHVKEASLSGSGQGPKPSQDGPQGPGGTMPRMCAAAG